jgi:hypothetical protein
MRGSPIGGKARSAIFTNRKREMGNEKANVDEIKKVDSHKSGFGTSCRK